MDERKYLILIHGENKTKEIQNCKYNPQTQRFDVTFRTGKTYPYGYHSVVWYKDPQVLNPALYQVSLNGKALTNIKSIFSFKGHAEYWHIVFSNGWSKTYLREELEVSTSCLSESAAKDCLSYLRALAEINELKSDEGEVLLKKQYENLTFVSKDSALAVYLNAEEHPLQQHSCDSVIFPFAGMPVNSKRFVML